MASASADGRTRRAAMNQSSWAAASAGDRDFRTLSQVPLDSAYQRYRSEAQGARIMRNSGSMCEMSNTAKADKVSIFVARKYSDGQPAEDWRERAKANRSHILLGTDSHELRTTAQELGSSMASVSEPVDLLKSVEPMRDTTLDGPHPASLQEAHFLTIHNPFESDRKTPAASFKSATQLREAHQRHTRSAYNPEDKFALPPTEQNEIGWKISDKYGDACAKYCDGAVWHARQGSHITKFSERLLLGARHHVSGPLAAKKLHY